MSPDFLMHARTESDRFAEVLRHANPAARVPSCPEWSAADLLWHLTEVHYFWAAIVRERITEDDDVETKVEATVPERPADHAALLTLYERTTGDLLTALEAATDDTPVWTWAADQSVGFVRRFQAHEALMHRVDAELTAGSGLTPLPAELATDGIDVVLRVQKSWRPGWADWQTSDVTGRIVTTDTGGDWSVRLGTWSGHSPDTGKTYEGETALEIVEAIGAPDFTVSAPAADLNAYLWNRPGFGVVSVDGPAEATNRFGELVRAGVQ